MKRFVIAAWSIACAFGCTQDPASAPIKLEPAPEAAPLAAKPAALPATPRLDLVIAPETPTPQAPKPEADAPVYKLRGQDGFANAKSSRGKIVVRFTVEDPCFDASPKVAIDLAARTLRVTHKENNGRMRCIPEPTDYRTTISGLPAGRFEISAPGLAAAFIDVPEPAEKIDPRARSVATYERSAASEIGEF